jgi:hypothetical protein
MPPGDEPFTRQIAIRVTDADVERIEKFARRIKIASPAAVTRAAIRIGLDRLEQSPELLFEPQPLGEPEPPPPDRTVQRRKLKKKT